MLENLNYEIKVNKKIEYLNLECGFDIETSSTYIDGEKFACMYAWCIGFGDGELLYYGRTWEEFQEICYQISNELNLSETRRLKCYVHNLAYEFQFMRKYFEWVDGGIFSNKERKPMKALTKIGIEFYDSLILSGNSLKVVAKNLQKHDIEKLVGDLDYSLVRHHKTPLSDEELKYLENDVKIILHYINEQMEQYDNDITKLPLTNTGRVRQFVKNNCFHGKGKNSYQGSKGKYRRFKELMNRLTLEPKEYDRLKQTFMGGFTHANATYTNMTLGDVHSIDFTSSYPAVMVSEMFPMSKGFEPTQEELEENGLDYYLKNFCCMLGVEFTNLKNVFHWESYLSEHKCKITGEYKLNNGRIYNADKVSTYITDVDYKTIRKCYSWDDMKLGNLTCYKKGYLPREIIESVMILYKDKTTLKDVVGKEPEYQNKKGMLNSVYGMTVTDIVRDNILYGNDKDKWELEKTDLEEEIKKYNEKGKRFLFYPWGVWITAYARQNLWSGIFEMEDDYIYSDTDSLKFFNLEKHQEYIDNYNREILKKIIRCLTINNVDTGMIAPKTVKGVVKPLGVWDYEGNYSRFKTLGAKRYMVEEDGKLKITVAGLGKENGRDYLLDIANNDIGECFELFTNELKIPKERTGKMTHTYYDDMLEFTITDYQGNSELVKSESFIHLENVEFSLDINDAYIRFFTEIQDGNYYRGDILSSY